MGLNTISRLYPRLTPWATDVPPLGGLFETVFVASHQDLLDLQDYQDGTGRLRGFKLIMCCWENKVRRVCMDLSGC